MIKLTEIWADGEKPFYVRVDAILWFGANVSSTTTQLSTPTFTFEVKETPEQIMELINRPIGTWVTQHHEG